MLKVGEFLPKSIMEFKDLIFVSKKEQTYGSAHYLCLLRKLQLQLVKIMSLLLGIHRAILQPNQEY